MPLAVTHVLVPIIILDLFRDHVLKDTKAITNRFVLLAGIAGLLPDMDFPIFSILEAMGVQIAGNVGHRLFLHNIWIPLSFLGFFAIAHFLFKKENFGKVFLILAFGFSMHLILDSLIIGTIMPFFPLSTVEVGLGLANLLPFNDITTMVSLDALLLLFWLWHEELEHKIKDYF